MPSSSSRSESAKSFGYHRIRNHQIAERIIASTGLAPPDLVFEFGPGDGQITAALASRCRRVVCIEADRALWRRLKLRFAEHANVEPVMADFMAYALPARSGYKLVSNVPFGLTAELFRRLLALRNPPSEAFLVLQLEAARKWGGIGHETLASVLVKTRFVVEPTLALHRTSFAPRPNVDATLLRLARRSRPLVSEGEARQFESFVRRSFVERRSFRSLDSAPTAATRPSELTVEDWVRVFRTK